MADGFIEIFNLLKQKRKEKKAKKKIKKSLRLNQKF